MARIKDLQLGLSSPQINAWAQYPSIHFRAAARFGHEYHFFDQMVWPEIEMLRLTGAPIMQRYAGDKGFVCRFGCGVERIGSRQAGSTAAGARELCGDACILQRCFSVGREGD